MSGVPAQARPRRASGLRPLVVVLLLFSIALVALGVHVVGVHTGGISPYGDGGRVTYWVEGGDDRDDEVRRALGYWEQDSRDDLRWDVVFTEADSGEGANLRIVFVDAWTVPCGPGPLRTEAAGCGGVAAGRGKATVAVQGRSSDRVTDVLTHEVGHALGRLHSLDPDSVMWSARDERPWWQPW